MGADITPRSWFNRMKPGAVPAECQRLPRIGRCISDQHVLPSASVAQSIPSLAANLPWACCTARVISCSNALSLAARPSISIENELPRSLACSG